MIYKYETSKYLDEAELGKLLFHLFGDGVVHNKGFIHNKKYRPDYVVEKHKLIFEFDGPRHYTQAKSVINDAMKDIFYEEYGYKVIRFPFFIQPTVKIINDLANLSFPENEFNFTYPHGFIDKNVVLPSDFCEFGVLRFVSDMNKYGGGAVGDAVAKSLIDKLQEKANWHWHFVIPPSLHWMVPDDFLYPAELNDMAEILYEKELDEDTDIEEQFYKNYKSLGGQATREVYEYERDAFNALCSGAFISGSSPFDRQQSIAFAERLFGHHEAHLIFLSLDTVSSYT